MACLARPICRSNKRHAIYPDQAQIYQVDNGHHLLPRSDFIDTINVDLQA